MEKLTDSDITNERHVEHHLSREEIQNIVKTTIVQELDKKLDEKLNSFFERISSLQK